MEGSKAIMGAFHPVEALILFWLSISIVPKAWRLAFKNN